MTTKTISNTITSGYSLSASYSALTVTSTGVISNHGTGVALTVANLASVLNEGGIGGGAAATGGVGNPGGVGGAGGLGVYMKAGGTLINSGGTMNGGAGGVGGAGRYAYLSTGGVGGNGGAGGRAVSFKLTGTVTNTGGTITGGAGGAGGGGGNGSNGSDSEAETSGNNAGNGNVGGVGVYLNGIGETLNNTDGTIAGGAGGAGGGGGSSGFGGPGNHFRGAGGGDGGTGAAGAAAIDRTDGGLIANVGGLIVGGAGGAGGTAGQGYPVPIAQGGAGTGTVAIGGHAGAGGAGVYSAGGVLTNNGGTISGGEGGIGGNGTDQSAGGAGGAGGVGVTMTTIGTVTNYSGSILGGKGGQGGYNDYYYPGRTGGRTASGAAGDAVVMADGGKVTNYGTISGANGIVLDGAGTVTNGGLIQGTGGDSVQFTSRSDYLIVESGATFTGMVAGGGGVLTIASGAGTITGIGSTGTLSGSESMTFSGFAYYRIEAGSSWTLTGENTLGASQGLSLNGGSITNLGTFSDPDDGLTCAGSAAVTNGAQNDNSALISGYLGVLAAGGSAVTVTNFGTIAGTHDPSVDLSTASDRLIAESGSDFIGAVKGGGGTLELASGTGVITGLGATGTISGAVAMTFSGFGAYVLDAGSSWTATGTNTVSAGQSLTVAGTLTDAGTLTGAIAFSGNAAELVINASALAAGGTFANTITGFGLGDSLDLVGLAFVGTSGAMTANWSDNVLTVSNGVNTDTVSSFNAPAAEVTFALSEDSSGSGGTLVTEVPYALNIGVPGGAVTGVGQATTITGLSLGANWATGNQTLSVTLTDATGLLSDGGAGVTSLVISGSLATVNADLADLTDTEPSAGPDSIVISANNGLGVFATPVILSVTTNGRPVITAPSSAVTGIGQATKIAGVSIAETGTTAGETFTVTLTDTTGLISDGGAGTTSLIVSGSLATVLADLANLTDTEASAGSDIIRISASDSLSNTANSAKISVTTNGLPVISAPTTAVTGVGQATKIVGVSLAETGTTTGETFTLTLTDATGLISDGGPGATTLKISGSLATVNADLALLTDTEGSAGPDTITITASDSLNNSASPGSISVTTNGLPTFAAPTTAVTGVDQATMIVGVSLAETGTTSGETFTVTLTDATGLLSDGGPGAASLKITGSLATVNADLASLTDTEATAGPDTITLNASDSLGNNASPASIAVTTNAVPGIAVPGDQVVALGQAAAIAGVSLSETGTTAGETFTVTLTDTNGLLSDGGAGSTSLMVSGSLTMVNADLAELIDTDASAGPDTIKLAASDSLGNMALSASIAVTATAQIYWTNPAGGTFETGADWSPGETPGGLDDAILGALASSYTVTTSSADAVASMQMVSGATLSVAGGTFTDNYGTGAGVDAGVILVNNGNAFQAGGAMANTGEIEVDSTGGDTELEFAANTTLSGTGSVVLSNSANNLIEAVAANVTLTNAGNIISGAGSIGGGGLAVDNAAGGVIDASAADGLLVDTAGQTFTNAGLMESTLAGAALTLDDTVIANGGGTIAAAGGVVDLEGSEVIGGTLAGTQPIDVNTGSSTFDGETGAITLTGAVQVLAGSTLTAEGTISGTGSVTLLAGGTLVAGAAGATLGGGTLTLGGSTAIITGASAAATLTNGETIKGEGFVGAGKLTLDNQATGVIDASVAGELAVNTKGETLTNAGLMESTLAGAFLVLNSTTIANAGGTIAGAGGVVDLQNSEVIGGTLAGSRPINVNTGSSLLDGADAGAVSVTGTVQVLSGTTLTAEGTLSGTGAVDLYGSATLVVGATGLTLTGGGQLDTNPVAKNTMVGATTTATLTNVNDHINVVGQLGDGSMILDNEAAGVIVDAQAVALTINTGAQTIANAGIIESDGKGGVVVDSAVANTGTLLAAAGTLTLDGLVTGTGIGRANGGVLYAATASGFEQDVTFGATGALKLGDSEAYTGTLKGFSTTGTTSLDLADIAYANGKAKATYAGTAAGGVLTVTSGAEVAHIHLAGNYLAATWTLSGDGSGGTSIVDPTAADAVGASTPSLQAFAQSSAGMGVVQAAAHSTPEIWRNPSPLLAMPRAQAA